MWTLFLLAAAAAAAPSPDARRLLDSAFETGASNPEFGVMALLHGGSTYRDFDKQKSLELLQQAFAAAAALPAETAVQLQGEVVKAMAEVSLTGAIEKLGALPDPVNNYRDNVSPVYRIVTRLLAAREFDRAIEVIGLVPPSAEHPFQAADRILELLPKDDSRRVVLFGRALEAYKRRPEGRFYSLAERHGSSVPKQLADLAVSALAARVLEWKDDTSSLSGEAESEDKPIEVHSDRQREVCDAVRAIRSLDPERAKRIFGQRPDILQVVNGMSKRTLGDNPGDEPASGEGVNWAAEIGLPFAITVPGDPAVMSKRIAQWTGVMTERDDIEKAFESSPGKALAMAGGLPPAYRAEAYARIAKHLAAKDRPEAEAALARCASFLGEEKEAANRFTPLIAMAQAADALKDRKTAWNAMLQALDAAAEFYRRDTNADRPNMAPRDFWPSTQAVRMVLWNAGRMWKAEAEPLLASIDVPDLALMGKIELARALLDKPLSSGALRITHTDK